ncbi:VC2662 family protein [Celerinatantimonas sp. MCCC 1A17872]|uniref:VC2662 family protein n=1 Tax=Celerinatantimonas sp. MCCC 1A17872 TaxID=3177514 RepID=UPI0038BF7A00
MQKSAITRFTLLLSLLLSFSAIGATHAQFNFAGKQFPQAETLKGARLSILYGYTHNVSGIDVPLLSLSQVDNFYGVQFSPFLGIGHIRQHFRGVALNLANWHEGDDQGVNIGLLNVTHSLKGANLGLVNISTEQSSVDLGLVNYSAKTYFQLGLVNATQNLQGLQIGLVNYAANGALPVLPIINFNKNF